MKNITAAVPMMLRDAQKPRRRCGIGLLPSACSALLIVAFLSWFVWEMVR